MGKLGVGYGVDRQTATLRAFQAQGGGGTPPTGDRRFWLFNSEGVYSKQALPLWDSSGDEVWQS